MNKVLRFDRKAISPVIATIIIVAVAIVMSIAVAYWMMGLATTFTRYEKLEYTAAYVIPGADHWNVTLKVKNTGTAVATINDILINGIPYTTMGGNVTIVEISTKTDANLPVSVDVGENVTIVIKMMKGAKLPIGTLSPGISIEIILVSATGNQYPKSVTLQ